MTDLSLLTRQTAEMLSRFLDPAQAAQRAPTIAALRPHRDDFGKVFLGDAAQRAAEAYDRVWQSSLPNITPKADQTNLLVFLAIGRDFSEENVRAKRFPGGYAKVASLLQPDQIWVAWKFVAPGHSMGMAYDGLVALGDRWAWFPKPWRFVLPSTSNAGHWTD